MIDIEKQKRWDEWRKADDAVKELHKDVWRRGLPKGKELWEAKEKADELYVKINTTRSCQSYIINGFPIFTWHGKKGAELEYNKLKKLQGGE